MRNRIKTNPTTSLSLFPAVISEETMGFLDATSLASISSSCSEWHSTANSVRLWLAIATKSNIAVPTGVHPKTAYVNSLQLSYAEKWGKSGRNFAKAHPRLWNPESVPGNFLDFTLTPDEGENLFGFFGRLIGNTIETGSQIADKIFCRRR